MSTSRSHIPEDLKPSDDGAVSRQLNPDDITTLDFVNTPSEVVSLIGYVGSGSSSAFIRLFLDEAMTDWLAIPTNAIADHYSLGGKDAPTEGKTILYVDRYANVVRCQSVPVSIYASPPPTIRPSRPQTQSPVVLSPVPVVPDPDEGDWSYEWPRRPRRGG